MPGAFLFAPIPGSDGTSPGVLPPWCSNGGGDSGPVTIGSCTLHARTDNLHFSSSTPTAMSIHGWWTKTSGTCPSKATVAVYLDAWACDGFGNCFWVNQDDKSSDVYPGGGSANRVAARKACSSSAEVGWQGYAVVTLAGESGSAVAYSDGEDWPCHP